MESDGDRADTPVLGDPGTIPSPISRRVAPRYIFKAPAKIWADGRVGDGAIADLSTSGARLEDSDLSARVGEGICIAFAFFPTSEPVRFSGRIARLVGSDGFGVAFQGLDPRAREMLRKLLPKVAGERVGEPELDREPETNGTAFLLDMGPSLHQLFTSAARAAGLGLREWAKDRLQEKALAELQGKPDGS